MVSAVTAKLMKDMPHALTASPFKRCKGAILI
jgi:hypothetical protein